MKKPSGDASTTNTIAAKLNETKQTQLTKETTACRGLGRPTTPVSLPDGSLAIVNLGTNMKTKTSELTGAALDWAVAKCEGYTGLHKIAGRMPHEPQFGIGPQEKSMG